MELHGTLCWDKKCSLSYVNLGLKEITLHINENAHTQFFSSIYCVWWNILKGICVGIVWAYVT